MNIYIGIDTKNAHNDGNRAPFKLPLAARLLVIKMCTGVSKEVILANTKVHSVTSETTQSSSNTDAEM